MDLGIQGRTALVCGASAGLGKAIARALVVERVNVTLVARTQATLEAAQAELSELGAGTVGIVAADVTTEEGREAALQACANPDILVNNAAGPPVGHFRKLTRDDWIKALDGNMLSAIDLINATLDHMIEQRFGRILNITSHMVKAPSAPLSLSNGARAGLTGYVGGIAREFAEHNVTINNLLPGQFDTDRLRSNHTRFAEMRGMDLAAAQDSFRKQVPVKRFGRPEKMGAFAAFLCSTHAGFMTGQNLMLDGGQYPGLF